MQKVKFQQMICGSTEKSITTGQPGFGVRSKSSGISDSDADAIFREAGVKYLVDDNRRLSRKDVMRDPQISAEYPPLFIFKKVNIPESGARYIVSRTIYVGVDYTYFGGNGQPLDSGANYLAHIMVFDRKPSMQSVASIIASNNFLPGRTAISTGNGEMVRLMCGEPDTLPSGEAFAEDALLEADPTTAQFVIALLQAFANKRISKGRTEVIVKAAPTMLPKLMGTLSSLPNDVTDDLYFLANAQRTVSVPKGMGFMIISDTDDTKFDRGNYVTVDYTKDAGATTNIIGNHIFDEITKAAEQGDAVMMKSLIELFVKMAIQKDTEYENAVKLQKMINTPAMLPINQLDYEFVNWVIRQPISASDEAKVWSKINRVLNNYCSPETPNPTPSMVRLYVDDIYHISKNAPEHLEITVEAADFILALIFDKDDKGSYLGRFLKHDPARLEGLLTILRRSSLPMPGPAEFFEALASSPYPEIWDRFIRFYYDTRLDDSMFEIVGYVSDSPLPARFELCDQLFPLEKNFDKWITIFRQKPEMMEPFHPRINDRYCTLMKEKPVATMEQLRALPPEIIRNLDIDRLTNIYIDTLVANSSNLKRDEIIAIANQFQDKLTNETFRKLGNICIILGRESFPKNIDFDTMNLAMNISSDDRGYVKKMYREWIKKIPSAAEVAKFLTPFCIKTGDASEAIEALWGVIPDPDERKKYILYVVDKSRWKGFKVADVTRDIHIDELREIIETESGFGNKMLRKFKSLFTKAPGGENTK